MKVKMVEVDAKTLVGAGAMDDVEAYNNKLRSHDMISMVDYPIDEMEEVIKSNDNWNSVEENLVYHLAMLSATARDM